MTMKKPPTVLALAALAALATLASPLALAEEPGWYGGASLGRSSASIDDARITANLLAAGLATNSISHRDTSNGYKIFGGYQLNQNFAVEAGFVDLGKFGFTASTTPPGTLNGDIRLRGLSVDMVGTLPVTEKFSVLGRVGLANFNARDTFAGTGAVNVINPNPSKRDTNVKFGLGLGYSFTPSLGIRLEAERYRVNDAVGNKGNINLVSVGLVYRFGKN